MKEHLIGHFWQRIPGVSHGDYWSWGYAIEANNPRTDGTEPPDRNNPHCLGHYYAMHDSHAFDIWGWNAEIHRNNPRAA